LRLLMEFAADPVPAELPHDREAVLLGIALDRKTDIPELSAGPDSVDAAPHAFEGDVAQAPGLDRGLPYVEHAARVAVVAVLDYGDIDIQDVARLELLVSGYAVAYHVIDGCADGL